VLVVVRINSIKRSTNESFVGTHFPNRLLCFCLFYRSVIGRTTSGIKKGRDLDPIGNENNDAAALENDPRLVVLLQSTSRHCRHRLFTIITIMLENSSNSISSSSSLCSKFFSKILTILPTIGIILLHLGRSRRFSFEWPELRG
jgi:hypothetical protein